MSNPESDAIVFFGASGDLAYKQIFPSLLRLVRDEGVNVPIVGVARSDWKLDQLKDRAKESLEHHGGADPKSFQKLAALLRYVGGDYNDPATFAQLRKELGNAQRPLHYLAIPPSLFGVVTEGLAKSGCATNARLVIEKPFGHNRETAQELNRVLHKYFAEENILRIDHYLGKEPVQNILYTAAASAPRCAPTRSRVSAPV
jgi:glucose-6-phosphate 1-dehydrogenase